MVNEASKDTSSAPHHSSGMLLMKYIIISLLNLSSIIKDNCTMHVVLVFITESEITIPISPSKFSASVKGKTL